jgi:hypothetical protein
MATLTATNPVVVQSDAPMATTKLYIKNGESWKAGQFLNVDASGLINVCATDDDASTGGGIKYYALTDQDDPGDSTTLAEVGIITADMVFEMNELDGTVSLANKDQFYALSVASNVCTVDVGDTGNDALQIVELGYLKNPALYDSTDTLAKVWCKVIPAVLNADPA